MKCSILYTTRNRGHLLDMGLWSILHGSRLPEEIIVVDDGPGGDNTPEVVRRWADQFRDIQISYLVHKREGGWANPAVPRNKGIRMSHPKHEILMFSEPEMLWHPDTLRTLMEWFENPPAHLPIDPREEWRIGAGQLGEPTPERFYLTASFIGYCALNQTPYGDLYQNFDALFGHGTVDRRWPEINTRVAAVRRDDVFALRGWDEAMSGWGYDDTDFMTRMMTYGVRHIPLHIPVVHLPHENPPAGGPQADMNLRRMQESMNGGIYAVNDRERWGLGPKQPPFGDKISAELWEQIQAEELASWTGKAWPSLEGKLYRERKYLKQAFDDLGLNNIPVNAPEQEVFVDVGCGPLSVLEEWRNPFTLVRCYDPLHEGYTASGLRAAAGADLSRYAYGRGERIEHDDNSVDLITSVNGIDHYEDPLATLKEMYRVLRPGGTIRLHYCVNNASEGHPHPAHRIDLDIPQMVEWGEALGLEKHTVAYTYYGWRHQLAAVVVFRKSHHEPGYMEH